jgi:hypothetical protein
LRYLAVYPIVYLYLQLAAAFATLKTFPLSK